MREGPICRCPECREGDIFELDEKLYTCTNCHRVWDLEEMYKTLWLDKLQRLIERRQALKNPSPSSSHLDRRIQQMRDDIMDVELLLKALEDKLFAMADDRERIRNTNSWKDDLKITNAILNFAISVFISI